MRRYGRVNGTYIAWQGVWYSRQGAPGRRLPEHGAISAHIQYEHDDTDVGGGALDGGDYTNGCSGNQLTN